MKFTVTCLSFMITLAGCAADLASKRAPMADARLVEVTPSPRVLDCRETEFDFTPPRGRGGAPRPTFDPRTGLLTVHGSARYRFVFLMARKERGGEPPAPPARLFPARERGDELVFDLHGPAIGPETGGRVDGPVDLRVYRYFNLCTPPDAWAPVWVDHAGRQNVRATTEQDPSGAACFELLLP